MVSLILLKNYEGPFIIYEGGWAGKNEGGGHDQSRRPEEGIIMKITLNKCRGPPNLLYTVNHSNNQNSA